MAVQVTDSGDVFVTNSDLLLHRALKAEKRCEQIRESARHWKHRAIEAEKQRDEQNDAISTSRACKDIWKSRAIEAEKQLNEARKELESVYKALEDARKERQQLREDLRSANEDYQAQHLELLAVKAHAYDLITGGTRV